MTPDELRYNALVVVHANLQRLVVMHNASAHVAGRPAAPATVADLHARIDVVNQVVGRVDRAAAVEPADVELIRPLAPPLLAAIEDYYASDLSGPPASQAAFGAAHVYASMYLNQGTIRMGEVFGHDDWADRARQHLPTFTILRAQAQATVAAAAAGTTTAEEEGFIAHHVRVAVNDRATMLAQVGGIPAMLDGTDPRTAPHGR